MKSTNIQHIVKYMVNDEIKVNFGKKVKFYRKQKELTQEKLAELAETTPQTLSGIETGYSFPSYHLLCRIMKALDERPARFFAFDDKELNIEDQELQFVLVEKFKNASFENRKLIFTILDAIVASDENLEK